MGYLIPKSARNVKMQLFKGLGIVEAVMVIVAVLIGVLIFKTSWPIVAKIVVGIFLFFVTLFMVSPSFIVNKKGYQYQATVCIPNSASCYLIDISISTDGDITYELAL